MSNDKFDHVSAVFADTANAVKGLVRRCDSFAKADAAHPGGKPSYEDEYHTVQHWNAKRARKYGADGKGHYVVPHDDHEGVDAQGPFTKREAHAEAKFLRKEFKAEGKPPQRRPTYRENYMARRRGIIRSDSARADGGAPPEEHHDTLRAHGWENYAFDANESDYSHDDHPGSIAVAHRTGKWEHYDFGSGNTKKVLGKGSSADDLHAHLQKMHKTR